MSPSGGRVVALDLGEVWTGVAVSDPTGTLARPLEVVRTGELDGLLRRLVREEGVREVLVGMPRTLRGERGFQARRVSDRLCALRATFPEVRFVEWDERLTTKVASGMLREGRGRGRRRERVDHIAAARMLQEYLELGGGA
ncbi:putative pre-16S rRNA nuclease [Rubrobacter xylanophilus]|uniref:Putative pre-16S rRNA nuclease n=1 Tax=Rubrobacter xylanophilus TaxID=49319 RepID=A0A510HFU7_9ACTN|nr:Holliday junction resolvase RuvX [Rubrobacter xylanophilus]BBL78819.1 putative pre-16S rRNA nuclease [Rubrobacter xylanophilus]